MSDGATEAMLEDRMWEETELLKASQATLLRRSLENDDDSIPEHTTDDLNRLQALDVQVGGDHYKKLKIQPVEYIMANELGFCEGSAIKYITRWKDKGGVQDIDKAIHFLQILKASLE